MNGMILIGMLLGIGFIYLVIASCLVVAGRADRQSEIWLAEQESQKLDKSTADTNA